MTTEQRRHRRAFARLIRQHQRAIVRAPKGKKLRAWAALKDCTTELLEQHVAKAA